MGDSYEDVAALGDKSTLKELCAMMSENEFVVNRKSVFSKSKYIIIAKLEESATEND
jgi:hypothetical protein